MIKEQSASNVQHPRPKFLDGALPLDVQRSMLNVECCFILNSGRCDAAYNMALDEALLESVSRLGKAVLRFYGWTEPAATFGYFQKYSEVEAATPLRPLIRRPTGGGIVPHDADWTYSAVFPAGHKWHSLKAEDSYRRIHDWLRLAFAKLKVVTELAPAARKSLPGQCFAGHEKFDLLWHGKKIAGAAQRRNRQGLLIQGSVQSPVSVERGDWERAVQAVAREMDHVEWVEWEPDAVLRAAADKLAMDKYTQTGYRQKR